MNGILCILAAQSLAFIVASSNPGHGTPAEPLIFSNRSETRLHDRAITTELSTCGYLNGNPSQSRTANSGYNCRVDVSNGLWGFCPTTVIAASDCGSAGNCVDDYKCSEGCGKTDRLSLSTFKCNGSERCSTALLTFGVDQTYSYIACGARDRTDHYEISPKATFASTTKSSERTDSISISPSPVATDPSSSSSLHTSSLSETPSESEQDGQIQSSATAVTRTQSGGSTGGTAQQTGSGDQRSTTKDSALNLGAIIGGVLGGLVLLCGTIITVVYLLRRGRTQRDKRGESSAPQWIADPSPRDYVPAKYPAYVELQELAGNNYPQSVGPVELPVSLR
ncbi:hypothetical protein HJFPF1_10852 [Paramyrothecium foliicola]|nr:hypothetical protein HJFPF1_10852 [Paramyrothecium foliicola]